MLSRRRGQRPAVARSQLPQLLSQPTSQRRNLRKGMESLLWSWITSGSGPLVAGGPLQKKRSQLIQQVMHMGCNWCWDAMISDIIIGNKKGCLSMLLHQTLSS